MNSDNAKRQCVLIVDDDDLVRQAVTMAVEAKGHAVVAASSGEEALGVFEPGRFGLVITDYRMPKMDGEAVATKIKLLDPAQPLVLLTAWAETLRERLQGSPFIRVLAKPIELKLLWAVVAEHVPAGELVISPVYRIIGRPSPEKRV